MLEFASRIPSLFKVPAFEDPAPVCGECRVPFDCSRDRSAKPMVEKSVINSAAGSVRLVQRKWPWSVLRSITAIPGFAALAMMIACAGVSTSPPPVSSPGTGTPTPHSVDLSWNASTSPDVSGYNLYRAPFTSSCGSFSKVNAELIVSTSYTDSAVSSGGSYCYATTAVDTSSQESGFSNTVADIQIPTP